jgi:hypothetical protein
VATIAIPATKRIPPTIGDHATGVFSVLLISSGPISATSFLVTRLNPVKMVIKPPITINNIPKVLIAVLFEFTATVKNLMPPGCKDAPRPINSFSVTCPLFLPVFPSSLPEGPLL